MIPRLVLAAVLLLLAAGCSIQQKVIQSFDAEVLAAHLRSLESIDSWNIRGRLGVRTDQGGYIGRLVWMRTGNAHQIDLYGSLGSAHVRISIGPAKVELIDSEGTTLVRPTVQEVFEAYMGWHFPMTELESWIIGAVRSDSATLQEWDARGRLSLIEQSGWRVRLSNYDDVNGYELPTRLHMTATDEMRRKMAEQNPGGKRPLQIRLVVNRWTAH